MKKLGIDQLDVEQRLALIEEIWESIDADTSDAVQLSDAQRAELQTRLLEDDADPDEVVSWQDVKRFASPLGGTVRAPAGGRVTRAAEAEPWVGKVLDIDHGGGVVTRYKHLGGFEVKVGDTVMAGPPVAKSGHTGRTTDPSRGCAGSPRDRPSPRRRLPRAPGSAGRTRGTAEAGSPPRRTSRRRSRARPRSPRRRRTSSCTDPAPALGCRRAHTPS